MAKALILAKRCCGSLASAIITTCSTSGEIEGNLSRKGGGEPNMCWLAISLKVPLKGRLPVNHSYTTIPNEYWSLAKCAIGSIVHDQERCILLYFKIEDTHDLRMYKMCYCASFFEKLLHIILYQSCIKYLDGSQRSQT